MRVAIVNLGAIVSGNWHSPLAIGDVILIENGRITDVGWASDDAINDADVVIDADGMTAIPGLIDSHVHITFGDYTPRQRTVGYLESYLHGGVTTAISASEVHVPGRPRDVEGVKALAIAAQRCFGDYRPGGMRVIAGSVILEPGSPAPISMSSRKRECSSPKPASARSIRPTNMYRWSVMQKQPA